jgi:glycolate oxidase iron-sulfur subunit
MIPKHIADLDEAVSHCMKCGFCKASCPVFIGEETTSPRAKVRLARAVAAGELDVTAGFKEQMERCLNCGACAEECPSGVEPNRIALAARCSISELDGLPLTKRLIFSFALKHPRLMALGSRAAGIAQQVSAIDLQNNPLRRLLPIVGMRRDKDLPAMGRRSLFASLPEINEPFGDHKITVAYFPGCAANLIYPEVGLATVSILQKLGARVILPHDLGCCSTPVWNSGDLSDARELAERNIRILSQIDDAQYLVTSCGSCGMTISQEWSELLGFSETEPIGRKVIDIADFVTKYADDDNIQAVDSGQIITYHDPCHLRRGMGVYETPRQLLTSIYGDNFVEMEQADRCCGGGGTFCVYHPQLSQTVAQTKMECLSQSGAGLVATGCSACVIQLRDSIVHRKMQQKATHTVTLIDQGLK